MITLEQAQVIYGDPEAIQRGYITAEIVAEAENLARLCLSLPSFGVYGYLAPIGNPHQWWVENMPYYHELSEKYQSRYFGGKEPHSARKMSAILQIANTLILPEKVKRVRERVAEIDSLPLPLGDSLAAESVHLRNWLYEVEPNF